MHRFTIVAAACTSLALALAACGDDKKDTSSSSSTTTSTTTPARSGGEVQVSMQDIMFVPHDIRVRVGQKIVWTNKDQAAHNVTATEGADFASDTLSKGATYTYTATKPGVINYVCTIHSGQDGTITVVTE